LDFDAAAFIGANLIDDSAAVQKRAVKLVRFALRTRRRARARALLSPLPLPLYTARPVGKITRLSQ
jgi:hypothetical protein